MPNADKTECSVFIIDELLSNHMKCQVS